MPGQRCAAFVSPIRPPFFCYLEASPNKREWLGEPADQLGQDRILCAFFFAVSGSFASDIAMTSSVDEKPAHLSRFHSTCINNADNRFPVGFAIPPRDVTSWKHPVQPG